MALIRSLNTAVTGLRAQQFRIEVIGNDIANVDTTAFKSTRVDFSQLLSQTMRYGVAPQGNLGGIDPVQVGLGTQVASTTTDFNQGPTEATGVNTDLAIQGDGFFILNDAAGGPVYTRDGSFTINPSNLLHDPATGYVVQGWAADDNFSITPGGPLQDVELQVGVQTIARPTSMASFGGNLNSSGFIADQGSLHHSDVMYDNRTPSSALITADNPLGLQRASADTPLANLVRSLGDYVVSDGTGLGTAATSAFVFPQLQDQNSGVEIRLSAFKGDRQLPDSTFVVGDPPPTGGTTLADFMQFMQGSLGVNTGVWNNAEQGENMLSYARTNPVTGEEVNGTLSLGINGNPDDVASLSSLTDHQADFSGVMAGDYIRFTSGTASGQIAQIVGVNSSTPGGTPDTLTFRMDGVSSLELVPATGDTYSVHAPAGVSLADEVGLIDFDGASPTVSVSPVATSGQVSTFTVTDSSQSNLTVDEGIRPGLWVEYDTANGPARAAITAVTQDGFTVSYDSGAGLDPAAGSSFSVIQPPAGTVEVASNAGTQNGLSGLEILSGQERVPLFDNPPVVEANGESTTMTVTVYDSLGTPRQVNLTYVFEGSSANGPNTWRYYAESADDSDLNRLVGTGTVTFDGSGQFLSTSKVDELVSVDLDATPEVGGGVESPFTFELDFSRLTQFATTESEIQLRDQDGFEAGTLRDFSIGEDGVVAGIFSNGLVRNLAQIPIARFANPNGLEETTDNFYRASNNSGIAQTGVSGTFGRGTLRSGVLEESNVDLAAQFTDLIIGQRAFQANARTISVSDEMLQELVNLI